MNWPGNELGHPSTLWRLQSSSVGLFSRLAGKPVANSSGLLRHAGIYRAFVHAVTGWPSRASITQMKAPKCYACEGRHWSTQPCPASNAASNIAPNRPNASNKVHLTASNRARSRAEGAGGGDGLPLVVPSRTGTAIPPAPPRALKQRASNDHPPLTGIADDECPQYIPAETKQRWSREDYNTYMRDYMARGRHG